MAVEAVREALRSGPAPDQLLFATTSPPYADQRAYSRIHPDRYVEWFRPFARAMYEATTESGSLVINIKNRVANRGPLKGQRHPYVSELVLALQHLGWRWVETYIWTFARFAQAGGGSLDTFTGGRLVDRFERRGGAWKIAHRRTVFDWNRDVPSAEGWCNGLLDPAKPGMHLGRKGASDLSYDRG
jgi:hypothetical protein